jgi:lipid-binding SYLF domain-containing protein
MKARIRILLPFIFTVFLGSAGFSGGAAAASAAEIDIAVDGGVEEFKKEVAGGAEFLAKAKGYLVFPKVTKAGLVVGGEYGEGALRIGGKTQDYYNIASASFGLQIGAQQYAIVMVFLEDDAMKKFRESKGWEAGVDGSVAIAKWGAGEDINTQNFKDPIVGFVFSNKGLMAGISIEGSKITKLEK